MKYVTLSLLGITISLGAAVAQATSAIDYVDARNGYSFTVPANWRYESRGGTGQNADRPGTCVDLYSSRQQHKITICGRPKKTAASLIENELRTGMEHYLQINTTVVLRSGSVRTWRLGRNAALSAVFDRADGTLGQPESITWVQSEAMRLNFIVNPAGSGAGADPQSAEAVQQEARLILDSIRVP